MLNRRTLPLTALLVAAASGAHAQGAGADQSELLRLQRQVDSLKAVIDSLRKVANPSTANPTPTGDARVVFSMGDWAVHRTVDKMTDAPICTGIYNNDWNLQLSATAFYLSLRGRGGVRGVTLRFDENPARSLRLATELEKRVSAVILDGTEFSALLKATRLRAEVLTILDHVVTEDIDLAGMKQAHDFISTDPNCRK